MLLNMSSPAQGLALCHLRSENPERSAAIFFDFPPPSGLRPALCVPAVGVYREKRAPWCVCHSS